MGTAALVEQLMSARQQLDFACGLLAKPSPEALDSWAARIRAWADQGLDVFVYFDNDVKVHAPYDALRLAARLTA